MLTFLASVGSMTPVTFCTNWVARKVWCWVRSTGSGEAVMPLMMSRVASAGFRPPVSRMPETLGLLLESLAAMVASRMSERSPGVITSTPSSR